MYVPKSIFGALGCIATYSPKGSDARMYYARPSETKPSTATAQRVVCSHP